MARTSQEKGRENVQKVWDFLRAHQQNPKPEYIENPFPYIEPRQPFSAPLDAEAQHSLGF